jgi:hypothetical protein
MDITDVNTSKLFTLPTPTHIIITNVDPEKVITKPIINIEMMTVLELIYLYGEINTEIIG